MQPFFTEQQEMLRQTARDFARRELAPKAAEVDEREEFPRAQFKGMAALGFTGMALDEEFGGSGGGYRDQMVVIEEVAAACGSSSTVLITHVSLGGSAISRHGSPEQKRRWVPDIADGKKIAAFALTEPGTGSDALGLETTARPDGENYILNGTKLFCTNGAAADIFVVFVTHGRGLGHKGISAIVVERGTPGFTVNPQHGKMGMKGCATAELVFQDSRVPRANRLGGEGQGYRIALNILDSSRISIAAQCVGLARGALDAALDYSRKRKAFGGPIAGHQAVQFMLADMAMDVDAARLMTWRAASLYDAHMPHTAEAAMAKVFASEAAHRVAHKALQVHGGVGYFRPSAVERIYRDQRVTEIYEGTSEIQRLVIARSLIGKLEG
ncbi:MAG: acyl-CoA dehydrogenase [Dehalococcoidia bacterium]|nr:acyl-CoA dehydrogenase [Dehalococcoidia bacterium]